MNGILLLQRTRMGLYNGGAKYLMPCGAKVALYYSKRMPTSSLATDPRCFLVDDLLHHLVISPLRAFNPHIGYVHLSVKFSQLEPNSQKINSEGEKQILWATDAS
jgi:hypothetical protein